MKLKKFGAALALSVLTSAAVADYRAEIDAAYADLDDGDKGNLVSGRFHFSKVETSSHPLAEAAFLQRSNNIFLGRSQQDSTFLDTKETLGQLELYIPQAKLYIAPFYFHARYKFPDFWDNSNDGEWNSVNDWGAHIGITPIEGMRISTTWLDEGDYELNLAMKYVMDIGDTNAINLELNFQEASDDEFDDTLSVGMDFYFDQTFSVGAEIENQEDTSFGIRTRKFFTEQFSASASYHKYDNYNTMIIGASLRF
ncbi:MAG: putative porin [Cellvibrionaceae bacterium]|nr:putative porin [Cellvibrionaceae bacterium]